MLLARDLQANSIPWFPLNIPMARITGIGIRYQICDNAPQYAMPPAPTN